MGAGTHTKTLNCTPEQLDLFKSLGKGPTSDNVEQRLIDESKLRGEIRFLMTHTRFEPNSNTDRQKILDGIPTIMALMGWSL